MTVLAAYALGCLSFAQLLVVSAVIAAAKIAFNAASGAYLRALLRPADLLLANARFESTTWSSTAVGPPLGGAAIGLFGPVTTVVADAASYLFSALGITAICGQEQRSQRTGGRQAGASELVNGWRHILGHRGLRFLYLNNLLVGGLIMATEPLLAVLLLRQLRFPAWQYGLAFAAPCAGGLIGSRLARRVVARYGQHRVFRTVGTLRAIWLIGHRPRRSARRPHQHAHGARGHRAGRPDQPAAPTSPTGLSQAAVRLVQNGNPCAWSRTVTQRHWVNSSQLLCDPNRAPLPEARVPPNGAYASLFSV
jgi:hypothetical protein